jgi:hypothetical protein
MLFLTAFTAWDVPLLTLCTAYKHRLEQRIAELEEKASCNCKMFGWVLEQVRGGLPSEVCFSLGAGITAVSCQQDS